MRLATFFAAASALSLVGIIGCQEERHAPTPPAEAVAPQEPISRQDVYNYAALNAFPIQVRLAFQRDFPSSAITKAEVQTAESGPTLYKIVYIQEGQPQSVVYDRGGQIFSPPAPPRIENRPGFPANTPPEEPVAAPPAAPPIAPPVAPPAQP